MPSLHGPILFCPQYGKIMLLRLEMDKENVTIHYSDDIMGAMAYQITRLTIVYSTVYSGVDQRKHQSSASLAFVKGIHRSPMNSSHKGPVTRNMFPFDDAIMLNTVIGEDYLWPRLLRKLRLAKRPLKTNGRLANLELTSLVEDATVVLFF